MAADRRTVEARIALIEKRRDLALIERPECKRRWATEPWEKQQERALRNWLLDRLEDRALWFAPDASGQEQPTPQSVRALADQVRGDADFVSVASLWASDALGRPDADLAEIVGALVDDEHVPFLAAYRYKPSGLAKRAEWEHTWALQRREDAVARRLGHDDVTHPEVRRAIEKEIGEVPVPPKYGSGDFLRGQLLDPAREARRAQGAVRLLPGRQPRRRRQPAARLGRVGPPRAGPGARRAGRAATRRGRLAR